MTNAEAIGILAIVVETAKGRCFVTDEAISDAYGMAISALQAQELSKNSPKLDKENGDLQPTCNQLATDVISRQAAVDEIEERKNANGYRNVAVISELNRLEGYIMRLPSAQPKIEERTEEFAQNVPKEDLISRKAAIDAMWEIRQKEISDGRRFHDYCSLSTAVDVIKDLPSAQPEPCEDCVSRQAAIDAALSAFSRGLLASPDIRKLPSVQPERKKGMWIDAVLQNDNGGLPVQVCDQCNTFFPLAYTGGGHRFCPNCGADMRGDDHDL